MKTSLVALLCLSSTSLMASEIACDYKSKVDTEFMGTISSSKNYNQKSYPYVDDTRICIVEMDVRINKDWYPTSGTYVFGPDMTETAACKRAEIRAKETNLRKIVPEKLNRTSKQNCAVYVKTVPVKKVPIPKVEIKKVDVYSSGTWRESGWKNVYTPVSKGCMVAKLIPTTVVKIGNQRVAAYKEVCRIK